MIAPDRYVQMINNGIENISFPLKPENLYHPVIYSLTQGGKRMRPVLCLMACNMYNGDIDKCLGPALGIEIFHNFTLVHDDIMDRAPIRRGKDTVYKKWNTNIAILSGDTMFAIAIHQFFKLNPDVLPGILEDFTQTAIEVCEGQQLDMDYETKKDVRITQYLEMIRLKTAVLLGCSLKTGSIVARANESQGKLLYEMGVNLGLSFQLMDDYLDVFGDEEKFGKISGGDIVTNKKTFLHLTAYESAGARQTDYLNELFTSGDISDEEKVREVKKMYLELEVDRISRDRIEQYYYKALQISKELACSEQNKKPLLEYAGRLLKRDH